jgi:hypothetical protein
LCFYETKESRNWIDSPIFVVDRPANRINSVMSGSTSMAMSNLL